MDEPKTPAIQMEFVFTLRNKDTDEIIFGPSQRFYTVVAKQELEMGETTKEFKFLGSQIFAKELVRELETNIDLKIAISGQPWYLTTEYVDGFYVMV